MNDIEWINDKAQRAKRRGDYETFETWRRTYLNAQAAQRRERLDEEAEKRYNEGS